MPGAAALKAATSFFNKGPPYCSMAMIFPPYWVPVPCWPARKSPSPTGRLPPTSGMARLLLEQLGQPRTLEELQEQVGAEDQGLLLTQLFQLQLDGAVRSLAGLRWVRIR